MPTSGGRSPSSVANKSKPSKPEPPLSRTGLRSSNKEVPQQADISKTESDSPKIKHNDHSSVAGQLKELAAQNTKTLEMLTQQTQLAWDQQQRIFFDKAQKILSQIEEAAAKKAEEKVRELLAPLLEENRVMQEEIKQLKERVGLSQNSSSSQEANDGQQWSTVAARNPQGQLEKVVSRLTECKMQEQDLADVEARKKKELNAVLRNFEQEEEETPESLKEKVDELFSDQLETSVVCVSARRMQKGRGTAQGIVVVQFEKKQHKVTVFKARGKLTGTSVGLDDDLTQLQQQRKNAAWPAFKDFRSKGIRTQWRAERLFVKEGERLVEHKVLNL